MAKKGEKKKGKEKQDKVKQDKEKLSIKKMVQQPLRYIKTHRLTSILIACVALMGIALLSIVFANMGERPEEIGTNDRDTQTQRDVQDLSIVIPTNAFPYSKSFRVQAVPHGSASFQSLKLIAGYTGNIFEVTPTDGRNDLALVPLTFRYTIPSEYYFGPEYNNFELVYVDDPSIPVSRTYFGSEVRNVDGKIVLESRVFDPGAVIGLRVNNPVRREWTLRRTIEKPDSLKPDLLVIPGTDSNFLGVLPNTITNANPQGNNIWEITFPDRSIWIYDYPLIETRSQTYMEEALTFFRDTAFTSYALFEADRLARSLMQSQRQFDIIAHGVGGIIARLALEHYPIENVRKVALISTPNAGTNVVNPLLMGQVHGKDPKALSEIFGVSEPAIRFVQRNNISFLEKVNRFYTDLLPDSSVIQMLDGSLRDDLEYLFVAGDDPGFTLDLEHSQLGRFFPENTMGKGDGVVSVYSAIYPHLHMSDSHMDDEDHQSHVFSQVFPYSFKDLYIQRDPLALIWRFLEDGIETVEIPLFQDDRFREWALDASELETFDATPAIADGSWITMPSTPALTATPVTDPATRVVDPSAVSIDDWKDDRITPVPTEVLTDPTEVLTDPATPTEVPTEIIHQPSTPTETPAETPTEVRLPVGTPALRQFVPSPTQWRGIVLPQAFFVSGNVIPYPHAQVKIPDTLRPFGLITHQNRVYLLTMNGTKVWERGALEPFSPSIPQAFFKHHPRLTMIMNDSILTLGQDDPIRESLSIPVEVQSVAVNDSIRYFLIQSNGLILETPFSSFSIPGTRGRIILYGMYPYVVTDAGIFLYDGRDLREIARAGPDYRIVDAILVDTSLFYITSNYTLHRISLDGSLEEVTHLPNVGGFKLLHTQDFVIVVGRTRINLIDLAPKPPVGSYYAFDSGRTIVDADLWEGGLLLLMRNSDGFFLEKVGISR